MAEHGKLVCTLARNKAGFCHPITDCPECRSCGWEETEAQSGYPGRRGEAG